MCTVYLEGAVNYRTYQKRFAKFCVGDFSSNAVRWWWGGLIKVENEQIKILLGKNKPY